MPTTDYTGTAAGTPNGPEPSTENPHAGQGPVLLDIGGDVGALIVTMPAAMEGVEIEIRPRDGHAGPAGSARPGGHEHDHHHGDHEHGDGSAGTAHPHLVHVAVVARPADGGVVHSAVFPDLVEGSYELSEKPFDQVRVSVAVTGGEVAQAVWPG